MPSTTQALRDLMVRWFPEDERGSTDGMVLAFLESRGFKEKSGMLYPPVPAHNVSAIEWLCIRYLVEEWDYAFIGRKDIECD
jgi:hypothetical protein